MTRLGRGGFGEVYKGFDLKANIPVAVKINHCDSESLEEEARVHCLLSWTGVKGIPQYYWRGFSHGKYCLVMEYLGKTIRKLDPNRQGYSDDFCKVAVYHRKRSQIRLSAYGFESPQYVMIGQENPNDIYMCDFGLAIPFMSSFTLKHIKQGS